MVPPASGSLELAQKDSIDGRKNSGATSARIAALVDGGGPCRSLAITCVYIYIYVHIRQVHLSSSDHPVEDKFES